MARTSRQLRANLAISGDIPPDSRHLSAIIRPTCRLQEFREQVGALRDGMGGEDEIGTALAEFDDLWASLTPKEQARIIHLLVGRIEYDGEAGTVSITFRPSGLRALEGKIDTSRSEAAA